MISFNAILLAAAVIGTQDSTTISAILQTRDGYLWAGGQNGLERYDGWEFTRTPLANTPIASLTEDATGTLWIGTHTRGLFRYRNGTMTAVAGAGQTIYALAEDRMRTMWAAGDDGVRRFEVANARPLAIGNPPNTASRAVVASGNDVWIGTDEGLFRYDGGAFTKVSGDVITALALDREGKLWIGTHDDGVSVYANGTITKPAAAAALALSSITALAADRDGTIWIGAERKGLCRFGGNRLDCQTSTDTVRAIYEDREGSLWVGTTTGGLHRQGAGVFFIPQDEPPRAELRDRAGTMWTGGPGGLTHDGRTYTVRDGLATTFVHVLAQDRDGAIWIGTSGGLSRFANGKITTIQSDGEADVRALYVDPNNRLWIGTTTGLRCVENARLMRCGEGRMRSNAIFAFDIAPDGTADLPPPIDAVVFSVLRDDDGTRWISTNKGIFRGTTLYAAIPSNGDVQPSAWRSSDGELWFVTARGVVSIDPKHAGATTPPPPVAIEDVAIREHDARFRYVALTFVDPQSVRYRTMLDGFDRGWTDAGTRRVAEYKDLPPGRYVFRVTAGGNPTGASMPIVIEPHFWQTWWFVALIAVAVAGVAAIALYVRRVEGLATIDPLTRVANRRSLDAALRRTWSAVILCDIDHFKIYNDTFGHQAGDRTLAQVAQAIASSVRVADGFVARYGGEEFIVLLARATADEATRIAERIVESVRALRIPHRDGIVTVSAGVAFAGAGDMIRAADDALYRAKAEGRNRFATARTR